MTKGIVVDHTEAGVRYAISESNFDAKLMTKVRDLKPGETVRGFQPKRLGSLAANDGNVELAGLEQPSPEEVALEIAGGGTDHATSNAEPAPKPGAPKTEGSSTEGTKGNTK